MPRVLPSAKKTQRKKSGQSLVQKIGRSVDSAMMERMPDDFQEMHKGRKRSVGRKRPVPLGGY